MNDELLRDILDRQAEINRSAYEIIVDAARYRFAVSAAASSVHIDWSASKETIDATIDEAMRMEKCYETNNQMA